MTSPSSLGLPQGYTLLRRLGNGPFGTVYAVLARPNTAAYALKQVGLENLERSVRDRLVRALSKAQRHESAYVAKVYGVEHRRDERLCNVLVEQCAANLRQLLNGYREAGERCPEDVSWRVLAHVAAALDDVHGWSTKARVEDDGTEIGAELFVHGNLKPTNVLFTSLGAVKVSDVGWAPLKDVLDDAEARRYMAPEVFNGGGGGVKADAASSASDVWSLGAIVYEMCEGAPPPRERPPPRVSAHYGDDLAALVGRMLRTKPADRISTAEILKMSETRQALDVTQEHIGRPRAAPLPPAPAPARDQSRAYDESPKPHRDASRVEYITRPPVQQQQQQAQSQSQAPQMQSQTGSPLQYSQSTHSYTPDEPSIIPHPLGGSPHLPANTLNQGDTELMRCAREGDREGCVRHLDQAGRQDSKGMTALMFASEHNHLECVKLLVEHEAQLQRYNGMTAQMIAAYKGHASVVEYLRQYESLMQDERGWTSLHFAAYRNMASLVPLLLHEAQMVDIIGSTALIVAASYGYDRVVEQLVEYEHGMATTGGHFGPGVTALMHAAYVGSERCIQILLPYEAHLRTPEGKPPVDFAQNKAVAALFQKKPK
ncbi:Kinase, NEK [Giardia muris]|uniref:Kinase, NEK n=1 Tax=Giardia muris TaxID=5742 RepID=A0A4Z1T227_GIAMU|nr:Kinase, NEK [Giardia muris]|eukprot:TNJ26629.1 Kinase, NEK [Giardia muris]